MTGKLGLTTHIILDVQHEKGIKNMTLGRSVMVAGFMFYFYAGISAAQNLEAFYPPILNGKVDFKGLRFIIRDETGRVKGSRPSVMRDKFILNIEGPLGDLPAPGTGRYFLKRDNIKKHGGKGDGREDDKGEGELEKEDEGSDTLIRYVRTLDDLQGFVKIRTETAALEFLRFGSSLIGYQFFDPNIREVYCIRTEDTSLLPDPIVPKVPRNAMWATMEECQRFGFFPPKILNPLTPKESAKIEKKENRAEKEIEDTKRADRQGKDKRFFLIERTVHASGFGRAPLIGRGKSMFLHITEEVGPEGQWRIVTTQQIPLSAVDSRQIISR